MKKLDGLIANEEQISLILLDVDLFKNINDALGHNMGDEVLKVIGRVLATFEEGLCFAARLGGDEFALVADRGRNQRNGEEIISVIKRQIDCVRTANLDLPTISITAGSAYFPKDASNGSDLLAAADIAQREAKKARRGGHLDYSARLSNTFRRETQIARAISRAIASRELFLCFQPKINLRTGRVEGAEALSRFSTEGLAGYSLDEIFEVAENRGIRNALGRVGLGPLPRSSGRFEGRACNRAADVRQSIRRNSQNTRTASRQAQPADGRWTAPVAHPRRNYRKCDLRPRSGQPSSSSSTES